MIKFTNAGPDDMAVGNAARDVPWFKLWIPVKDDMEQTTKRAC